MPRSGIILGQEQGLSDADAVRAVLAGQRDAFAVLVRRHLPAVKALAFSRTSSRVDAEDVAQEVLLRAFKYLGTLKDGSCFGAWVAAIARNVSSKALAQRLQRDAAAAELDAAPRSVMPDIEQRDLRRVLSRQINRLDAPYRDVLALHYFAGMSTEEVAPVLGISRAAVKKRLQRARAMLGQQLTGTIEELRGADHDEDERQTRKIMGLVLLATPAWEPAGVPHSAPVAASPPPRISIAPAFTRHVAGSPLPRVCGLAAALLATVGFMWWAAETGRREPGAAQDISVNVEAPEPSGEGASDAAPIGSGGGATSTSGGGPSRLSPESVGLGLAVESVGAAGTGPRLSPAVTALSPQPTAPAAPEQPGARTAEYATDGYVRKVDLNDVPLSTALEVTLRQLNLDYSIEDGYIWISTPDRIRRRDAEGP